MGLAYVWQPDDLAARAALGSGDVRELPLYIGPNPAIDERDLIKPGLVCAVEL
jgi:hypothetical protein